MGRNFTLNSDVIELLMGHNWKGNVRELESVIERALISAESDILLKGNFKALFEALEREQDARGNL
jgi:transcriptional regulator with PAS, ATPase and Fis domain